MSASVAAGLSRANSKSSSASRSADEKSRRIARGASGPSGPGLMLLPSQVRFPGGEVHGHGDHRIAMAFSVASLRATAPIRIHDCANVATSFPNFLALCKQVGMRVAQEANS